MDKMTSQFFNIGIPAILAIGIIFSSAKKNYKMATSIVLLLIVYLTLILPNL